MATMGYRRSTWWLVAGYLLHAGWDVAHDVVTTNDGVPHWWPGFCFGFDGVIAAYLAWRERSSSAN